MALRSLSTSALRAELARREKGAARLQKKHGKLARVLATLEAQLADLGVGGKRRGRPPGSKNKRRGRPPGSKNKRRGRRAKRKARRRARAGRKAGRKNPKNKQSLGNALASAIRPGTVISPVEAAQRVKAAGYKSNAGSFNVVVAMRMRDDKRFKKQGRGEYVRVAGA